MTYVTEQTPAELRAHMRRLKAMPGWHEPLADRLFREILELDARVRELEALAQPVAAEPVAEVAKDFVFFLRKQPDGSRWPVGTKLYADSPPTPRRE